MEITSFSVQELADLYNKTITSSQLSTGFVQRGLITIENELSQRGYKVVKSGEKYIAVLRQPVADALLHGEF